MKKVELVRIQSVFEKDAVVKNHKYVFNGIEEEVNRRLSDGWSFEGTLPIVVGINGELRTVSLIFSKE